MYALISSFTKSFDDIGLTYFIPNHLENILKIGNIVQIPFGNEIIFGIVLKLNNLETNIDDSKIKSIIYIYDENIYLDGYRQELCLYIAKYYFSLIHNSVNLFLPKNLRQDILNKKISNYKSKNKIYLYKNEKDLNENQKRAYNEILNSNNNNILLYGLTGSGKTEIYINLIKNNLENNKQSLLLVPEIILTNQLYERIKNVFGNDVIIINSSITETQKKKNWLDINSNNAKIVIGTRSSIFYPYNNLGLIIIDEEHDNSYISDKSPRYNTIEVAEKITELNQNKLVLGSGTPSIKTMFKTTNKKYELVNLLNKY